MPIPSEAQLKSFYKSQYRFSYQLTSSGPSKRHIEKRQSESFARFDVLANHLNGHRSLLDFGCGSGEMLEVAQAHGMTAIGFEPGLGYSKFARETKGLNVVTCGYHDFKPDQKVDLITSFQVFEHLNDPRHALETCQSWLSPKGLIFIDVPDMKWALHKGFGCLHRAHVTGFTKLSLEYLGAVCGLRIADGFQPETNGYIFQTGTPRPLDQIAKESRSLLADCDHASVVKQFWKYSLNRLIPGGKKRMRREAKSHAKQAVKQISSQHSPRS